MARAFDLSEVLFTTETLPEDHGPEGSFASGDDEADRELCESIRKDLDSGNDWAWCVVKISAKWGGFEGTAYLGGCSYKDEDDFANGGYLAQMQEEAVEDLKSTIRAAGWDLREDNAPMRLSEAEQREVHHYLFCDSAAKDIAGTHVKGPNAYKRVTAYLAFLRDKLDS